VHQAADGEVGHQKAVELLPHQIGSLTGTRATGESLRS
jgi:hypothetical protein